MLLLNTAVSSAMAQDVPSQGVIVEVVTNGGAAALAGIQVGDRLTGWATAGAANDVQPLLTPFDFIELEKERVPISDIVLHGVSDGASFTISLGRQRWQLQTRPNWNADAEREYAAIVAQLADDDVATAVANVETLASRLQQEGDTLESSWLLFRVGRALFRKRSLAESSRLLAAAAEQLDATTHPTAQAQVRYAHGVSLLNQSRFDDAIAAFSKALQLQKALGAERLGVAENLIGLGRVASRQSDLPAAKSQLEEGLWLQERIIPGTLLLAGTLNELGRLAVSAGELESAEAHFRRALEISEGIEPGGKSSAGFMNSIAIVHYFQGDEAAAADLWTKSLELKQELEPGSANVAAVLHNVGLINAERGFFREAESYYLQSLQIEEQLEPDSVGVARTLNNLGTLALTQGDLSGAQAYHQRALAIRQKIVPDSLDLVATLNNLGNVARQRGDLDKADLYYLDALDIQQRIAPNTSQHAMILINRGVIAEERGDLEHAYDYFRAGLATYATLAPAGRGVAESATKLGNYSLESGNPDVAEQYFDRALTIFEAIAPNTYREAEVLYGLARIHRLRDDLVEAGSYFERALRALETQHAQLGGNDESKSAARARHNRVYKDYIEFLLEQKDQEKAFDVLERSRAKVLSDQLAERDLVFSADIPEDLERERRILAHRYEQLQADLYNAEDTDEAEQLRQKLQAIRQNQSDLRRRITEVSSRFAGLQSAEPLRLAEARQALPADTALVSFNVGDSSTSVFVVDRDGNLKVHTVDLGHEELIEQVSRFRFLIDAGRWDDDVSKPLVTLARRLYDDLLLPVEANIDDADRLLLIPDGALNILPFAALMRANDSGGVMYLAQWKASFTSNSLTVYAQLEDPDKTIGEGRLVAFGDPDYNDSDVSNGAEQIVPATRTGRGALRDLPWSFTEVSNIRDVYRNRATVYTGAEATEERAKNIDPETRFVHFAAHAYLNEHEPLDTSIVLASPKMSTPDAENGYLQVWEVYESLRLDADLVTLSGCETALGTNYPGEGLIGLTRAFQYAGASSVLATLWNVNDRSTSELMTHFYSNLAAGMPQEKALQQAQLAMIRGASTRQAASRSWLATLRGWFVGDEANENYQHPYRWAGFVLNGHGG